MLRDNSSDATAPDRPWSDYHQQLSGIVDADDLAPNIQRILNQQGFTDFNYRLLGKGPGRSLVTPGIAAVGRSGDDMMLNHIACTGTPMLISKIEQHISDSPIDHPLYRQTYSVIRQYKCHGFNDLYYLSVESSYGQPFGLSVGSKDMNRADFLRLVKTQNEALCSLVKAIDDTITRRFASLFSAPQTTNIVLPPRPLRVLTEMLVHDLTLTETAKKLHISIHTANKHMAVIKNRLGCNTLAGVFYCLANEGIVETILTKERDASS